MDYLGFRWAFAFYAVVTLGIIVCTVTLVSLSWRTRTTNKHLAEIRKHLDSFDLSVLRAGIPIQHLHAALTKFSECGVSAEELAKSFRGVTQQLEGGEPS